MNNVAELVFWTYKSLEEHAFRASERFFFEHVLHCLNESANQVLRDTKNREPYQSIYVTDLLIGTAIYDYPTDILDREIQSVWYFNGSQWSRLKFRAPQGLDIRSASWRSVGNAVPISWSPDPVGDKIRLYPPPSMGYTLGLSVIYIPRHPRLYRFWGTVVDTTKTINVTNGSTSATLSVAATAAQMQSNDYIGIIEPKPTDLLGIAERTASLFYKATLSGTSVTLDRPFEGSTDATAYFVAGQNVALLERYEVLAWPVIWQAAKLLAEAGDEQALVEKFTVRYGQSLETAMMSLNRPPAVIRIGELA